MDLQRQVLPGTKGPAHPRQREPHLAGGQVERSGHLVLVDVEPLGGDVEVDPSILGGDGQARLGPQKSLVLHADVVFPADHHVSRGERVAPAHLQVADDVAVRVYPVTFGPQRQCRVQDRRQRRVLDPDGSRAPPSGLGVVGRHYGHGFPLVAHLVDGQDGLVGHLQAVRLPPGTSSWVSTQRTPGMRRAADTSTALIRARRVRAPYGAPPDHRLGPQV